MARGLFITFEGTDGVGKSTQAALLVEALRERGLCVVPLREPGGTWLGEKLRSVLLDPAAQVTPQAELLLFEAARAQLVTERIRPALAQGAWVVCDRFYDSTTAYQHGGRGLDRAVVDQANRLGSCGLAPDLTVLLDLDPARALRRGLQEAGADRLEAEGVAFERAVRQAYEALAQKEPGRVAVVDAAGSPEEVAQRVWRLVAQRLAVTEACHG